MATILSRPQCVKALRTEWYVVLYMYLESTSPLQTEMAHVVFAEDYVS